MNETPFAQSALDYQRIEQAIRFLEANFQTQPSLDEMAAHLNLSKFHFQRLFKRWAGVTPTQFMQYLTVEYAKSRLESQSVLGTALDAGLSGPGRLHDLFVNFEAMSPGEVKQQGAGLTITYGIHASPFGPCLLAVTERGICALRFLAVDGSAGGQTAVSILQSEWPAATLRQDETQTAVLMPQLFGQAVPDKPFHLLLRGTNFQVQVWRGLLTIPAGQVRTYSQLAEQIGRPSATRAVASAIARNPIGYLIPCHRVIRKSGDAHQYRWGAARKKAILGWEAALNTMPVSS